MSTVTTDSGFYWYIRSGPKVNTIGIINEDGDAVDSSLTVELHAELSNDAADFTDDAEFLLPDRYVLKFIKGVINEYMNLMHGQTDPALIAEYESGKIMMRALTRTQKYGSDYIKPKNLRGDKYTYRFTRSANS